MREQNGVFQTLLMFAADKFEAKSVSSSHSGDQDFSMKRKNQIHLVLLGNGEVFTISESAENTVLPATILQSYTGGFFDPSFYMTGIIDEKNGTTLVSFIIRNVSS